MKYHKIRNVPMDVCTAEQKLAYNVAFRCHISFGDKIRSVIDAGYPEMDIADLVFQARDIMLNFLREDLEKHNKKYDIDAVFCALNAGLRAYIEHPHIYSNYEDIGKAFPAYYL